MVLVVTFCRLVPCQPMNQTIFFLSLWLLLSLLRDVRLYRRVRLSLITSFPSEEKWLGCLASSHGGKDRQDVAWLQDPIPIGVPPVDEKGAGFVQWDRQFGQDVTHPRAGRNFVGITSFGVVTGWQIMAVARQQADSDLHGWTPGRFAPSGL
jgi:hypothetical protein